MSKTVDRMDNLRTHRSLEGNPDVVECGQWRPFSVSLVWDDVTCQKCQRIAKRREKREAETKMIVEKQEDNGWPMGTLERIVMTADGTSVTIDGRDIVLAENTGGLDRKLGLLLGGKVRYRTGLLEIQGVDEAVP